MAAMKYQEALPQKRFAQLCAVLCLVLALKTVSTIWMHNMPKIHQQMSHTTEGKHTRYVLLTVDLQITYNSVDSDGPRTFPIEPLRPVRSHLEDSAHYQISGDDEEWNRLIPGDGAVYLKSSQSERTMEYTVSIYHQLRCLDIIRRNIVEVERRKHHEPEFNAITPATQHCINYLREMVLCRGDLDLETIAGLPKSDVILYQYQCWDWEAVYSAVKNNQDTHRLEYNPEEL